VHGAVARLAEAAYADVPAQSKPIVRAVMLRLVGSGEGDAAVRRRVPLGELDLEQDDGAASVLASLVDGRLVSVSEGSVEVAHEALLREWPRLRAWIDEDAQGRRLRRHITEAARDWDAAERDPGELYRGPRLAAALEWSAEHDAELNDVERGFLAASREATEIETKRVRRTNRRLRGLLAGVAVLLAAAVAGGIFAVLQRGEARDAATAAREAETAQVAQRLGAQALVEEDLDRSLLLARQAVAIDDTPQTRGYLLADLLRAPGAIGIMHGDSDLVRDVAISPDGKTLAVADFFGGLLFFDALTHEQIGQPDPRFASTFGLAYSPDGERLAVGGYLIQILDARTRQVLAQAGVGSARLAFSRDGSLLVTLGTEGAVGGEASITLRDATTLKQVGGPIELEGFTTRYVGQMPEYPHFALTPDGSSILTASDDGELAWWDLESHEKTRTLKIAGGHHALAISPDGRLAAVGVERGIQLVDLRTGAVRTATGTLAGSPTWVLFSPDSQTVVTTGLDGTVTLWDAGSGIPRETLRGHSDSVQQPMFSPDGETLYTASHDGTVIAWDISGDRGLGRPFRFTHDRVFDVAYDRHPGEFSPDGSLIALGLKEEGIALWDAVELAPTGEPLRETGGEVKVVAFSPDGRTLAAGTTDGMVTIWDVPSRSLRHGPFRAAKYPIIGISISTDGTLLATAGGAGVRLWDVATGVALGRVGGTATTHDVAFSPVGSTLVFVHADDGNAEVWDVAEGLRRALLRAEPGRPGEVLGLAVAFSPDGTMVATSGLGQPIYLWNARSGELIRTLERAGAGVLTLDFSPDGTLLAASGFEPVATLWDVATGTQIGPRLTAGNRRAHIDLSPDGRSLLLVHGNGQGAVFDIDPRSWARRACALANRTLTPEEWAQFLPRRPYAPACAA
jgi:WD40 repeat protein